MAACARTAVSSVVIVTALLAALSAPPTEGRQLQTFLLAAKMGAQQSSSASGSAQPAQQGTVSATPAGADASGNLAIDPKTKNVTMGVDPAATQGALPVDAGTQQSTAPVDPSVGPVDPAMPVGSAPVDPAATTGGVSGGETPGAVSGASFAEAPPPPPPTSTMISKGKPGLPIAVQKGFKPGIFKFEELKSGK